MKARSYPYLHISKKYGIDYGVILNYAHNCFSRPASELADLPAVCREEILNAKWEFQLLQAGLIPYETAPRIDHYVVTMDETINDMAWVLDRYATACGVPTNARFFNSQKVLIQRLVQQWVNANHHLFKDDVL